MRFRNTNLIAVLILALAFTVNVLGQDKAEQANKNAPKLSVEKPEYDLGKVEEGKEVTYTFKIKNEGNAELVIKNVSPACGCTASDFSKTVAPGQEGKVTLTVKTAGMNGKTSRYADVISNDPKQPNLQLWLHLDVQKAEKN